MFLKSKLYELNLFLGKKEKIISLEYLIQQDARKLVYFYTQKYLPGHYHPHNFDHSNCPKFYGNCTSWDIFGVTAEVVCPKYGRGELFSYFFENMNNSGQAYIEWCIFNTANHNHKDMVDYILTKYNIQTHNDLNFIISINTSSRNMSEFLHARLSIDEHFYRKVI